MIDCIIPNVGNLRFNPDDVPTFYPWSGYAHDINEYKTYNFLAKEINSTNMLICSSANGVGLCEYLSRYIIKSDFLFNTEDRLSPDIHYWFYRAWEQAEQDIDEQGWFKKIVQIFIDLKMIIQIAGEKSDFFCLIGFEQYEDRELPKEILNQIKDICEDALAESSLIEDHNEE